MQSQAIKTLRRAVAEVYGLNSVSLYGATEDEDHGTAFTVAGIPATFSAHTQDDTLLDGHYDIQIESLPPGDCIYTGVVSQQEFMRLIAQVAGPSEGWPVRRG